MSCWRHEVSDQEDDHNYRIDSDFQGGKLIHDKNIISGLENHL